MSSTRESLLVAAYDVVRDDGLGAASARTIAGRAGVNQALVFYHFDSVDNLVAEALVAAAGEAARWYEEQLARVASLTELLAVGRGLTERERDAGRIGVMAQLMAGAQHNPRLADAARLAMGVWVDAVEAVLRRVLAGTVLADIVDPAGLARTIASGFIGLQLYEGADPAGAAQALDTLEQLGRVLEQATTLGPVARRAVRSTLRSSAQGPSPRRRGRPSTPQG